MVAFHNDRSLKDIHLNKIKYRYHSIEQIPFKYGLSHYKDGKGDAIGIITEECSSSKATEVYEELLGIPKWLVDLKYYVFENTGKDFYKFWPEWFLSSINVGADLNENKNKIISITLIRILEKYYESTSNDYLKDLINDMVAFLGHPWILEGDAEKQLTAKNLKRAVIDISHQQVRLEYDSLVDEYLGFLLFIPSYDQNIAGTHGNNLNYFLGEYKRFTAMRFKESYGDIDHLMENSIKENAVADIGFHILKTLRKIT